MFLCFEGNLCKRLIYGAKERVLEVFSAFSTKQKVNQLTRSQLVVNHDFRVPKY